MDLMISDLIVLLLTAVSQIPGVSITVIFLPLTFVRLLTQPTVSDVGEALVLNRFC